MKKVFSLKTLLMGSVGLINGQRLRHGKGLRLALGVDKARGLSYGLGVKKTTAGVVSPGKRERSERIPSSPKVSANVVSAPCLTLIKAIAYLRSLLKPRNYSKISRLLRRLIGLNSRRIKPRTR